MIDRQQTIDLLHGLVAVPSLSREEAAASVWLVERMAGLGYDRAFVDAAGNAVGEMGPADAPRTVVLLGHIDTVPGKIPVRIEDDPEAGPVLFGRGSVDAKGPLAAFVCAVAKVGSAWAAARNVRLVVVGAVEEEAATSKGARFIRDRFDGEREPVPDFCIIGEPSDWRRVTLGYKGRILVDMEATQGMAHTAGPDAGVGTVAISFWNRIDRIARAFNATQDRLFDQLQPSLRHLSTWSDAAMQDRVAAKAGIRLPMGFDVADFASQLARWAAEEAGVDPNIPDVADPTQATIEGAGPDQLYGLTVFGETTTISLKCYGYEPAWRSERNNALVRAFLGAIRAQGEARPGFVVKTGTSDMNVVAPAWGCPILAYGPGDSSLDHTPHEHLPLADYWQAVLVLERVIRGLGE